MCWHGSNVSAQHVADGPAALLHRRAGERGEADDVADGVNVRHGGLEMLVAAEPAAFVGFEAGALQAAARSVSPTRPTLNNTVSPSSRLPLSSSTATRPGFGSRMSTTLSPSRKTMPSERAWCSSVSMISRSQNSSSCVAAVDDGHLHAERGEHDGVFEADHAAADDDHRTRHVVEVQEFRRSRRPFRR